MGTEEQPSMNLPAQPNTSPAPAAVPAARSSGPITLDTLRTAFHQPREQAAETLGLSVNELKKTLKQLGVARWPYRKLASLQSLHQDLEQQLQQFSANANDASIAAHIKDLKEMQARISDDTSKIMQDPNHPLDEGLHKLRLQNYKARFLGKHGLSTAPPMLKMPAVLAAAAGSASEGGAGVGGSQGGVDSLAGGMDETTSQEVGSTGRRRRAASIAASNSIKRAAGLVGGDSDDDEEYMQPSSQRSKSSLQASPRTATAGYIPGVLMRAGSTSRSAMMPVGPATLAALPSLPEGSVFQEHLYGVHNRLAQSAPLFDESQGGLLRSLALQSAQQQQQQLGRTSSGVMTSINDGVAAISLQQQQQQRAQSAGLNVMGSPAGNAQFMAGQAGNNSSGGGATQFYSRQLGVPQHLLPRPNTWMPSQGNLQQMQQQQPQQQGGIRFTSAPVMQFSAMPGHAQQYASNSSLQTDTSYAQVQSSSQASLAHSSLAASMGLAPQGCMPDVQQQGFIGRQSMPTLAGGQYMSAQGMHSAGVVGTSRLATVSGRHLPVVEPLVTPLEELLDEMMNGSEPFSDALSEHMTRNHAQSASAFTGYGNGAPNMMSVPQPAMAAQSVGAVFHHGGQGGQNMQQGGMVMGQVSGQQQGPPGSNTFMTADPGSNVMQGAAFAGVPAEQAMMQQQQQQQQMAAMQQQQQQQQQPQQEGYANQGSRARMPNSNLFLLNSDDEDDHMLASLLASPSGTVPSRMAGNAVPAMTRSERDAAAVDSQQLAAQQAQLQLRQQQLVAQAQQLRAMQQELAAQAARLQQHQQLAMQSQQQGWNASGSAGGSIDVGAGAASCPALSSMSQQHTTGASFNIGAQGTMDAAYLRQHPNLHTISASPRPMAPAGTGLDGNMSHNSVANATQQGVGGGMAGGLLGQQGVYVKTEDMMGMNSVGSQQQMPVPPQAVRLANPGGMPQGMQPQQQQQGMQGMTWGPPATQPNGGGGFGSEPPMYMQQPQQQQFPAHALPQVSQQQQQYSNSAFQQGPQQYAGGMQQQQQQALARTSAGLANSTNNNISHQLEHVSLMQATSQPNAASMADAMQGHAVEVVRPTDSSFAAGQQVQQQQYDMQSQQQYATHDMRIQQQQQLPYQGPTAGASDALNPVVALQQEQGRPADAAVATGIVGANVSMAADGAASLQPQGQGVGASVAGEPGHMDADLGGTEQLSWGWGN